MVFNLAPRWAPFEKDNERLSGFEIQWKPTTRAQLNQAARMTDASDAGDALLRDTVTSWRGLTPEVIRALVDDDELVGDAQVEAMRAELSTKGLTEYPYTKERLVELLDTAPRFLRRLNDFVNRANPYIRSGAELRKNASASGSSTGASAAGS